jgi:HEPN domain-containing protein
MENRLTVGQFGKIVDYFDGKTQFKPEAKKILEAYEILCAGAIRRMRYALSDDDDRKEAICYYASVKAIHGILSMYLIEDEEEAPDFEDLMEFAKEVKQINFMLTKERK